MSVRGARARLFAHDDNQFDDAQELTTSSADASDEDEWQQPAPSWRNRIVAGTADDPAADSGRRRGTSIISLGTSFNGTLRSEDPLYIEGQFDGEIIASSDVTIAKGAQVNARIQAIRLTVAGHLSGTVACTDRFEAVETGIVSAEVLSPTFVVHDGATINGSLKMRLDDDEDEPEPFGPDDDDGALDRP
ncbi:hypothetical protein BH23CHL2_BH23CHL2_20130 [soil metagenome]